MPANFAVSAVTASYTGMLSFFPLLGLPFAIGAVVSGSMALRRLQRSPELLGRGRAIFGLIVGILLTPLQVAGMVLLIYALTESNSP